MRCSWIVSIKNRNHVVLFDISEKGERQTIIVNGQIILDNNAAKSYCVQNFKIEGMKCRIDMFGISYHLVFFVKLYVDGILMEKFQKNTSLHKDVNPNFLTTKLSKFIAPFEPTPGWYWLFAILNMGTIFLIRPEHYWSALPPIIFPMLLLQQCSSNPYKFTVKQRFFLCVAITIVNFIAAFLIYKFVYG